MVFTFYFSLFTFHFSLFTFCVPAISATGILQNKNLFFFRQLFLRTKILTMKNITVEQLKHRMDAGEKINLIDVREPDEYKEFNIGAKLIPLGQIQAMQIDELEPLKNEEVILHCRSGKRSVTAAMFLETMGFTNTVNVEGGVLAWIDKFGMGKVGS
jgi:rhodanese-related sulfurtransferase